MRLRLNQNNDTGNGNGELGKFPIIGDILENINPIK